MQTEHWLYKFPRLDISGQLKTFPEDFQVTELLGYEPLGEGEHIYLWIQKTGLNTAYLAEQIAKYFKLPLRAITYAGRKDKHAQTTQWFGIHSPGKTEFTWDSFDEPNVKILKAIRHNKKLRTGILKGNRFDITIRHLSSTGGVEDRLMEIAQFGVPNYYGSQRFGDTRYGKLGGNLTLAEKIINGEAIRNRNKRSMAISAMRSWLFNEMVHTRLQQECLSKVLPGDVMQLAGNKSFFCVTNVDDNILQRIEEQDVYISAPLWGSGELASQAEALNLEQGVASKNQVIVDNLQSLGLKQERRAVNLFPKNLEWELDDDTLHLAFSLPAGTFATSLLREVIDVNQPDGTN